MGLKQMECEPHMRQRVSVSMPLEREMTGTPSGISGATLRNTSRENCTGTA